MSEETKSKSPKFVIAVSAGAVVLLLLLIYLSASMYFRNRFLPNTWIGDVYCTGKNIDAVARELNSKIVIPDIRISWLIEGEPDSVISHELIDYRYDLERSVYEVMDSQNPFAWPAALFTKRVLDLEPDITYDESRLRTIFYSLSPIREEVSNAPEFSIRFEEGTGYCSYDNHHRRLDVDKAYESLKASLDGGRLALLLDGTYFRDIPYSDSEKKTMDEFESIMDFLNTDLVYDMGAEQIAFDRSVMSFLIVSENGMPVKDDEGNYQIDDEAVMKWVDDLCKAYDTYGLDRSFTSSTGKEVMIPAVYSTYGTELDHEAEEAYLLGMLHSDEIRDGIPDVHIPEYIHEATFRGRNDIGDTFIEVDLTDQYLYFYKDGELLWETDIVSGDIPKGWTTPRGVFAINGKATDQWLWGKDYMDFVSYWMPYFRGYGLHDSDWRDEWGGEIYTYDGSHGCINMNKESAAFLYENVEIGTPVVVYDY